MIRLRLASVALALSLAATPSFAVETLLKPVPAPDLSKVSPEARAELQEMRRLFDEAKAQLLGDPLADAFLKLGALYGRHGLYEPSRIAIANAIALSPYDGRYYYLQGVFAQQAGKLAEARTLFARAVELDLAYLPMRYRLADAQFQANDYAGVRKTLTEIASKRTDLAPAPALLGEVALREKKYAEAVRWFEQAVKADPAATSLYRSLAAALTGAGDKARAAAAKAKAGDGIAAFSDPLVQGMYGTAQASDPAAAALALAAQGRHADARTAIEGALKVEPANAVLLAAAARIEADAGNPGAARQRADAALKADPNGVVAKLAQGVVAETGGQEAQAVTFYEQAVRADLKNPEARLLLGNAYMRRQAYPAAAEQYRQMIVVNPGDASAYMRLAAAESMAGRCGSALATIDQSLKSRPKDAGLNQTFVRLASTCSSAKPTDRQRSLAIAEALYQQRPDAEYSEAYALALAANGRAAEAVDLQAQSMFDAAKERDQPAITRGRTYLKRFEAGQAALQPWPLGHPLYAPARLTPAAKVAVAATKPASGR